MSDIARKGDLEVKLVDPTSQQAAKVDNSGRLLVSQAAVAPSNTTEVLQVAQSSISANTDTIYTITNGKTLVLQIFQAGSEANTTGGSKVSLYEDPNGNLSVLNLIAVIYINGNTTEVALDTTFTGNGTRRIVMRRGVFAGPSREVTGRWKGFEQ